VSEREFGGFAGIGWGEAEDATGRDVLFWSCLAAAAATCDSSESMDFMKKTNNYGLGYSRMFCSIYGQEIKLNGLASWKTMESMQSYF